MDLLAVEQGIFIFVLTLVMIHWLIFGLFGEWIIELYLIILTNVLVLALILYLDLCNGNLSNDWTGTYSALYMRVYHFNYWSKKITWKITTQNWDRIHLNIFSLTTRLHALQQLSHIWMLWSVGGTVSDVDSFSDYFLLYTNSDIRIDLYGRIW